MLENRRKFLEKVAQLGALSVVPVAANAMESTQPNHFTVGPYLQHLTPTELTIVWVTSKHSFSWVEYGEGTYTSKRAFSYNNGLIEANNLVHKITLYNLKPGTKHKYKVVSTEITGYSGSSVKFGASISSKLLDFTTPALNESEIKVAILNDVHDRPQTYHQMLYRHGYTGNNRDYDFVVYNGDVFDHISSEKQLIAHLLQPSIDIFAQEIPFVLTQGNHECRGSFARQLPAYFGYPDNKYYYSFTRGPVRFLILDSGEDKADDNVEYGGLAAFDIYRENQRKWLEKEIASEEFKKAAFRVLIIHISPWHSGEWHGTLHCRSTFGPLLNKANIDLQVSGHTHRYTTHEPDNDHNFPIFIGGGPITGNRTLIKLHATPQELNVTMIKDDGEIVGKRKIVKKNK